MYTVYAIRSKNRNYIYVGITNNLKRRLSQHYSGKSTTTRAYRPFDLVCIEQFKTRQAARNREKFLKSRVGKEWLKNRSARVAELVDAHV